MNEKNDTEFYAGYECLAVQNDLIEAWITISCGPRIIGLCFKGGENLMAVLPEAKYETPSGKEFWFRGGHRLWHGPEDPERTYVPDDESVRFEKTPSGVRFAQNTEQLTGIQKSMEIRLAAVEASLNIEHAVTNRGSLPVELAPWAITQLKPGGAAILPQETRDTGLLPNRRINLWPYTDVNSPQIEWGNEIIIIQAQLESTKLKIGWANPAGWLAYWRNGTVFVKYSKYQKGAEYIDYGSSAECFSDSGCLELETLGPLTTLEPGQTATHQEKWLLLRTKSEWKDVSIPDLVDEIESELAL
jgi:hypothetical protein